MDFLTYTHKIGTHASDTTRHDLASSGYEARCNHDDYAMAWELATALQIDAITNMCIHNILHDEHVDDISLHIHTNIQCHISTMIFSLLCLLCNCVGLI